MNSRHLSVFYGLMVRELPAELQRGEAEKIDPGNDGSLKTFVHLRALDTTARPKPAAQAPREEHRKVGPFPRFFVVK